MYGLKECVGLWEVDKGEGLIRETIKNHGFQVYKKWNALGCDIIKETFCLFVKSF